MKKKIIISVIVSILIIFSTIMVFSEQQYDFRKTNWGMSREQVKTIEDKKPAIEDNTMLAYEVTISGRDFACIYNFLEDKLYQSIYYYANISAEGTLLFGKHTNENLYIDDYKELKEILTKKYGKPLTDRVVWKNDLYRNDKQDWGFAVSIGHLSYIATWETNTTEINILLFGDNYQIISSIGYNSRELEEWVKKIKEEKAKSEF